MEHIKYIPAWNGNREKKDPIVVEIHPLTRREVMSYAKMIKRKLRKGFRDDFEDNAAEIQEKQFMDNIGKVTNLKNIITGKSVTNAEELYDAPGCSDLFSEIVNAMEDASSLMEGEEKNFAPPSAGQSKGNGGTVKVV